MKWPPSNHSKCDAALDHAVEQERGGVASVAVRHGAHRHLERLEAVVGLARSHARTILRLAGGSPTRSCGAEAPNRGNAPSGRPVQGDLGQPYQGPPRHGQDTHDLGIEQFSAQSIYRAGRASPRWFARPNFRTAMTIDEMLDSAAGGGGHDRPPAGGRVACVRRAGGRAARCSCQALSSSIELLLVAFRERRVRRAGRAGIRHARQLRAASWRAPAGRRRRSR